MFDKLRPKSPSITQRLEHDIQYTELEYLRLQSLLEERQFRVRETEAMIEMYDRRLARLKDRLDGLTQNPVPSTVDFVDTTTAMVNGVGDQNIPKQFAYYRK